MNSRVACTSSRLRWAWIVAAALCSAGCGAGNEPKTYRVSGTVTFAGRPVPAGTILFVPDAGKANRGATGYAVIRDGKFDTRDTGKGAIGGPHQVRISGEEPAASKTPSSFDAPVSKPLFAEHVTTIDLPKADSTHDFQVPAAAPQRRR